MDKCHSLVINIKNKWATSNNIIFLFSIFWEIRQNNVQSAFQSTRVFMVLICFLFDHYCVHFIVLQFCVLFFFEEKKIKF